MISFKLSIIKAGDVYKSNILVFVGTQFFSENLLYPLYLISLVTEECKFVLLFKRYYVLGKTKPVVTNMLACTWVPRMIESC